MKIEFWRHHLLLPVGIALALFATAIAWGYDLSIGHVFFAGDHWLGGEHWWVDSVLHRGAQRLVILAGVIAAVALLAGTQVEALRRWRRPLAYFVLNLAFGTGLVAAIKSVSGVPCPWSLREFGGSLDLVMPLYGIEGGVPGGGCFPAAHAACGYSFFSLYFLLRDVRPRRAPVALALALTTGLAFGFAQQARGAHLITHDIASAAICWVIALTLYATVFRFDVAPAPARWRSDGQPVSVSPAGLTNL